MVAVIKTGSSISRMVNYNEQKVKQEKAECIAAFNYPKDVEQLSFSNKLNRLTKQAALNENVSRNAVHISLNFDPSETLSKEVLQSIAETFMQRIGFGDQPYLVYQHNDAGHPHIHIATIKVKADGKRIDTQNIGRNQSQKARLEIEEEFGLVKANEKQRQGYQLKPVNVQKVLYGRTETKRAIAVVLDAVLNTYKYTSLPELNAILQQYNVIADRGSKDSRTYKNNGLVYRVLDEQGKKVGVPIKASDIYNKPTLPVLETKFPANEAARLPHKTRLKNAIDLTLLRMAKPSLQKLIQELKKQGIDTVLRQNEAGLIYGITFIDHQTKSVFNGSSLGKAYSSNAIQKRCSGDVSVNQIMGKNNEQSKLIEQGHTDGVQVPGIGAVIDKLLDQEQPSEFDPALSGLAKKKRKKKQRLSQ